MSKKEKLKFGGILIKIRGGELQGKLGYAIDQITLERFAKEINEESK